MYVDCVTAVGDLAFVASGATGKIVMDFTGFITPISLEPVL